MSVPAISLRDMANAVRALSIDAIDAANSGHPGMPLGAADIATVLYTRVLRYDAANPEWHDRDRFVLSAGHASAMLYALSHLAGYPGMTLDQVKNFRQKGSLTPGHPEVDVKTGVEMTTGPLGQGLATAVGMAIAERALNARFGDALVDHYTWVLAGDGDFMEGVSHEAGSLAGSLRLSRLIVLYDYNQVSIDGPIDIACGDDTAMRFRSYGWNTLEVDGHDYAALEAVMQKAKASDRPTLVVCKTKIGLGSPSREGKAAAHSGAFGSEETARTKKALGWNYGPFEVPAAVRDAWGVAGRRGAAERDAWQGRFAAAAPAVREGFLAHVEGRLPNDLSKLINEVKRTASAEKPVGPTRMMSGRALESLAPAIPSLIGGSADLTPANNTWTKVSKVLRAGEYGGNYLHYGVREHGMAAAMNGIAIHGGFIPYGGSFLTFTDYCKPAIRLAALMKVRSIFVMTHDSIGLGEDGPTHQSIEHLPALRAVPNVLVLRPADAVETAECWQLALENANGPTVLSLSRQPLPTLRLEHTDENLSRRGAYVLAEAKGKLRMVLIATGGEVAIAMQARDLLEEGGIGTRVVSMPCREIFLAQPAAAREALLPAGVARLGVEAASPLGWGEILGPDGALVGMTTFGMSAPDKALFEQFGFTGAQVAAKAKSLL